MTLLFQQVSITRDAFTMHIDARFEQGVNVAIVGPNGSGKSSLIEVAAGFDVPAAGTVIRPPGRIGYVPQDGLLIPHLTLRQNLDFGTGVEPDDLDQILADLRLDALADRKPGDVSGGEQQRAALARALVRRPVVLLLDEPLSKVDVELRRLTRNVIDRWARPDQVQLVATHGADHARQCNMILAIDRGRIVTLAPIEEILHRPPTPWLAEFFGVGDQER